MRLLVLFDIDGTLLLDDERAHRRAALAAMRAVWDVRLPDDAIERSRPWGKTDLQIVREVLAAAGVADADGGLARWAEVAAQMFVHEAEATARRWRVRDELAAGLERLASDGARLALLTGNLRAIAEEKVRRMGVAGSFELDVGGYGSDAEERAQLVPLARRRAGGDGPPWPRARAVVVGDTPLDVEAAAADGVAAVAFSSARYPRAALGGAQAVVDDVPALVETLLALTA